MKDQVRCRKPDYAANILRTGKTLTNVLPPGVKPIAGSLSESKVSARNHFSLLADEPGRSEYNYIRQLAENLHSNPGPGKALPTFVTKHYVKDLDGAIDIWDTGPLGYDIKRADEGTPTRDTNTGSTTVAVRLPERLSSTRPPRIHAPPSGPASNTASITIFTGMVCTGSTIARR
jgi:hypothetical protein